MKRIIALVLACALTFFCASVALAQEGSFTCQPGPIIVNASEDGTAEVGALYIVRNDAEIPLYFDAFHVSVLDKEGNMLAAATMDSCAPRFIMPGQIGYVWCTTRPAAFSPEQLGQMSEPKAQCFGFPDLRDASEEFAVSDAKCEVIPLENGEETLRFSAMVTNTGSKELSGCGGYFLMEGTGEKPATFPIAFKDGSLLGKLAPGESVSVGAELTDLLLRATQILGYDSINPDELRFTTHAFASKLK